jgi:hypothetical protein
MKKILVIIATLGMIAGSALAHNPHALTKMGTVKAVQQDHLVLTMSDGDEETVLLSAKTAYFHADNHAAKKSEIGKGMRVVVKMTSDGKSAATVTMSAPKKK